MTDNDALLVTDADRQETDGTDGTDARTTGIGRRGYLKLAGGAAASFAALGGAGTTAGASYETITIPAGERYLRRLTSGESFENVLIDISAPGAVFKLIADGTDWTVRNVGIRGRSDTTIHDEVFNLAVEAGGTALLENVYMGDGAVDGEFAPIFVPLNHAGTMRVRRLHTRHWPNNGFYGSAPGRGERDNGNGVIEVESSYARNDNIDGFRLGTDGSYLRNSVVHVDGDVPGVFGGIENGRGVWVKEGGRVMIEDCDILIDHPDGGVCIRQDDGADGDQGVARVLDSQIATTIDRPRFRGNVTTSNVGSDPDVTPPAGVPMSAEEAAAGGDPADAGPTGPGLFTISNRAYDTPASYEFTVDGALEATDSVNPNDELSGSSARGQVNGGSDAYRVAGAITDFRVDGPVDLSMDGEAVTAAAPNRLEISNEGFSEPATYGFAVSGALEATDSVNPNDELSGSSARGQVNGGSDAYHYGGEIEHFEHDGPVAVFLNGAETDTSSLLPHELRIQAVGEFSTYRLAVSDVLQPGAEFDDDGTDEIVGSEAQGQVNGTGADNYHFSGEIENFTHDGPLDVYLDGEQVDPARFARPANHLRIQAVGERSAYRFEVGGALEAGPDFDTDGTDGISERVGQGRVAGTGADDFYFDGGIVRFERDGPLETYVDGEQVDPDSLGYDHVLSIVGNGTGARYELSVSGDLAKSTARNASINPNDEISGSTATGYVGGGIDSYAFDGDVTDFSIEDSSAATVYLDGTEVDPDALGLGETLTIRGEADALITYDLEVSGGLEKSDAMGATIDANDEVSGSRAQGQVNGGTDSYAFGGEIEYLAVDGRRVSVYLDGEEIDPGQFPPPHTITISNRPYDTPATYRFGVSGALEATDSVNTNDVIDGSEARGQVNRGSDTYRYSGDVTSFENDGPVDVSVDGKTVQSSSG